MKCFLLSHIFFIVTVNALNHQYVRDNSTYRCYNPSNRFSIQVDKTEHTEAECIAKCDANDQCQVALLNELKHCAQYKHCYAQVNTKPGVLIVNHKIRSPYTLYTYNVCNPSNKIGDTILVNDYGDCKTICDNNSKCMAYDNWGRTSNGKLYCRIYSSCTIGMDSLNVHTHIQQTIAPSKSPTVSPTTPTPPTLQPTRSPTTSLTPREFQEITNKQIKCINPNNKYRIGFTTGETPKSCADKCNNNPDCTTFVYNNLGNCIENKFCEHSVVEKRPDNVYIAFRKTFADISNPGNNVTVASYIGEGCVGTEINIIKVDNVHECLNECLLSTNCNAFTVTSDGTDPVKFYCTLQESCIGNVANVLSIGYDIIDRTTLSPTKSPLTSGQTEQPTISPSISPTSSPVTTPPSTLRPTTTTRIVQSNDTSDNGVILGGVLCGAAVISGLLYYFFIYNFN